MNRTEALALLKQWNPDEGDLPDAVAAMLDDDEQVRAAFDARFAPVDLAEATAPELDATLARDLVAQATSPAHDPPRPANSRRWLGALGAVAAAALVGLTVTSTTTVLMLSAGDSEAPPTIQSGRPWGPAYPAGDDGIVAGNTRDPGAPLEQTKAGGKGRDKATSSSGSTTGGPVIIRGGQRVITEADNKADANRRGEELAALGYIQALDGDDKDGDGRYDEGQANGVRAQAPANDPADATTENYTDYGHHDFVHTGEDRLSTFAIDVDTASYTNVRRMLNEGYLPPAAAVRVEEFVNYFPYDYPAPQGDPFSVDIEGGPNPWNPRTQLVRFGVQGKRVNQLARKPVHLTFLVDTSGSMQSPDKMGLVKRTLTLLTEELEDGDTVSIVAYAGSAGLVLPPTPMSDKQSIRASLRRLEAGGSTAMGAGIDLAYRQAMASYHDGAVNRVVVCSDGDANVGEVRHGELSKLIRGYAQKGVTLTTVGFGSGNYNDTMMEQLANDGDGNYFYIDSEREARRVFVDKLTGTMQVIAKDVKIQVDWDPSQVVAYRLVGYENRDVADRDFRNDKVDAGEIGSGHQVTAIYEVALAPDGQGPLGTIRVRNKAPGPDSPAVERSFTVAREVLQDDFQETSKDFRLAFAAASFAERLRGSPHLHHHSYRQILPIALGAQRAEYDEDAELVGLIRAAAKLSGE